MRFKSFAVVATLALLAGCVPSLHAFHTDADLVFEPVFRLGAVLWLDVYPVTPSEPDFHDVHLVPAHTVSRVWPEEGALPLGMLSHAWLESKLERGRSPWPTSGSTAPTAKLRVLRAHADDAEAFGRPEDHARADGRRVLCIEAGADP